MSSNTYSGRATLWVVSPCFYDTTAFAKLRRVAREQLDAMPEIGKIEFVLIDDSGGQDKEAQFEGLQSDVMLIQTPYNLGHQSAIVYGLRLLADHVKSGDFVVTMDSDGEDSPEDIPALIRVLAGRGKDLFSVVLAERTKRSESALFKTCYAVFKVGFRLATGTVVKNGNFAAFRGWIVQNVLFHPFFDICYSSSLLALPLHRLFVPLARGERYFGHSKMTMTSLVSHGFRMLLPFSERISIRALVVSLTLFCISFVGAVYFSVCPPTFDKLFPVLFLTFFPFLLAALCAICSCIFFQVFNQSRAMASRILIGQEAARLPSVDSRTARVGRMNDLVHGAESIGD